MKTLISSLLVTLAFSAQAQITSTFDADADGWTFYNASFTSIAVNHNAANGNPGGYISATYSSASNTTNANTNFNNQVWFAPSKFLGNHLVKSLGMNLKFDLQQSQAGTASGVDVVIQSGGTYIYFNLPLKPVVAPAWSTYSLPLDETLGWIYSSGATIATRSQIKSILTNVTSIEIRGTYATNASYISGLDNVILEQRTLTPAPLASSLSATSGRPGDVITINGSGFNATLANNIVSFGEFAGTKAVVQSATATRLDVVVPLGAVSGRITITNTITGLTSKTSIPFIPVFEGGGRIIPSSFGPKFTIATIQNEGWFVGDIDGDGWEDFGVANNNTDNAVDIYRNLGLGGTLSAASFAAKVSVAIPPLAGGGANGAGLWFADLDGDGKLDAISSNKMFIFGAAGFVTLRNTSTPGNISFETPEYWVGGSDETSPSLLVDIDGDGRPEMIAGEGSGSGLPTARNMWIIQNISTPGDIDFGTSVRVSFLVDAFSAVNASDLDNDGKPELLVSWNFGDRFSIIKNNSTPGNISLTDLGTISTGQYNVALQGADFNLDGKNDLAWKKTSGEIYIRLNTNIGAPLLLTDFATEFILTSDLGAQGGISIADVNGDSKLDIVATDNTDVGVYENIYAGGVFDASAFVPAYQVLGGGAYSPRISDLNHDTKPDFLLASGGSVTIVENKNIHAPVISLNTVSPLKGIVGSTVTVTGNNFSTTPAENIVWFGAVKATVLTAAENLLTVEVPAGATYAPVSVTKNGLTSRYHLPFQTTFGSGVTFDNTHFAPPASYTLTGAGYNIETGDLNVDGRVDILASAGNTAYAFRNDYTIGSITTTTLIASDTLSPTTDLFGNPRLEDFDGDGYLDVASTNTRIRKNITTGSNINFTANINYTGQGNLAYADFNQDGKMDIAVSNSGGAQLNLIENRTVPGNFTTTGTYGSFSSVFAFAKPGTGGEVVAADFDADGFPDVITVNITTDNISIFRNIGGKRITAGQFAARVDIAVGDMPNRIYKGDFDSDGKLDLMLYHAVGTSSTLLIVLHNTSTAGNISFSRIDLTNPSAATVAHIADLDGDGKPEILTTSEAGNRFSIFKNIHTSGALTAASFAAPFNTTVTAPRGITTGDLNLDGKPEIILTRAAGLLVVYENLISSGPSISISTQPTFIYACEGSSATFSVDATGTTNINYRWQKFNGTVFTDLNEGSGYTGTTTKTLSINTSVTSFSGNGEYRCRINGDLAPEVFSDDAQLTINGLPSPPDVTGASKCVSPSTVTLTAAGGPDGDYNWYDVATGGSVLGVNGSFTTPSITSTTTYYVSIEDTFCESTRAPVVATIALLSKPVLTSSEPIVSGGIDLCDGENCTLNAPNSFAFYTWSTGETTQQITVNTTDSYSLIVEDASGCASPASDPINVTINPFPAADITVNGEELTASVGGTYQWFQNGDEVDGATSQSFEFNILEYGVYLVEVTDNGCTSISPPFEYLITGVENFSDGIKLYPNPVEKILFTEYHPPYTITILNKSGMIVGKLNSDTREVSIDFSTLANGIYILQLKNEKGIRYQRVTKK